MTYFSIRYRTEVDDLDEYEVASFQIGNRANFDLRKYAGHRNFTTSLYLPFEITDEAEITDCVEEITVEFKLPATAVAWRRGMAFRYGELNRPEKDRLRESEARVLALKIAAASPNYTASMSVIKREVEKYFEPSIIDMRPSPTRGEPMWKQIMGNVVSHKDSRHGLFRRGLAKRTSNGLTITPQGLSYLKSIGFVAED